MNELKEKNKEPIFVIGFPKSGNTWLARLLAESTDSNIGVTSSLDVINSADNTLKRRGNYIIYKEHVARDVEKVSQAKTVYIVRDVRDVLISGFYHCNRWCNDELIRKNVFIRWYYDHELRKLNKMWQGNTLSEFKNKAKCLIKNFLGYKYEKVMIGNWSDHVLFWTRKPGIVVRYEDLLQSTEDEMRRILEALNINVSDDKLKETISNQSFKKKKAEFIQLGNSRNIQFLRGGKSEGWRSFLSPAITWEIESAHASVMSTHGYKLEYYKGEK